MRIDKNLNRTDLKIKPPAGLKGKELASWNQTVDMTMEVTVDGEKKTLTGQELPLIDNPYVSRERTLE